jgi:hypothetical protein
MRTRTLTVPALLLVALVFGLPAPAFARIKLAALPERERVEVQFDHGRATLVEEERIVPLLASTPERGNNRIDFSWTNTRIDKDSIQFRPLAIRTGGDFRPIPPGSVEVINVAYPPGENALVWEVYAKKACALKVRVSYLIDNLSRSFHYRALANRDETHLLLKKYLQIVNYSGEDFGTAGIWAGFGPRFVKELGQQEEMRVLHSTFPGVPIEKTFTFNWYAHGSLNPDKPYASKVLLHYRLTNDAEHGLGRFPLKPGKVRIFMEDGHGGEAFLGEDRAALTPLDGKMRLYLGEARDVVCTRTIKDNRRHPVNGNLFNQELWIKYEVENFKDKPVTLDIVEQLNHLAREYAGDPHGDVEWDLGKDTTRGLRISTEEGGAIPILSVDLPARPEDPAAKVEKRTFIFHLTLRNIW